MLVCVGVGVGGVGVEARQVRDKGSDSSDEQLPISSDGLGSRSAVAKVRTLALGFARELEPKVARTSRGVLGERPQKLSLQLSFPGRAGLEETRSLSYGKCRPGGVGASQPTACRPRAWQRRPESAHPPCSHRDEIRSTRSGQPISLESIEPIGCEGTTHPCSPPAGAPAPRPSLTNGGWPCTSTGDLQCDESAIHQIQAFLEFRTTHSPSPRKSAGRLACPCEALHKPTFVSTHPTPVLIPSEPRLHNELTLPHLQHSLRPAQCSPLPAAPPCPPCPP